jgi:hypothetical protein
MTARRTAWTFGWVTAFLVITGLALNFGAGSSVDYGTANRLASALVYVAVGAIIAERRPRNSIGWLFCVVGVLGGIGLLARGYTEFWLAEGVGPTIVGETAAVHDSASWVFDLALPMTLLLLLFPDGRLPSRRWIWSAGCAVIGTLGFFVAQVLYPGPLDHHRQVVNPYGIDQSLSDSLNTVFLLILLIGIVSSAAAPVVRFRRGSREQRGQIKWMALAATAVTVMFLLVFFGPLYEIVGEELANALLLFSVLSFPIATAFAILRRRLYDIDVVINRALVYGSLTAMLAAVYLGSVLLLQLLLERFTQGSGLAVAASTLATAALARPARARIQATVDHRFFRRKYDAAQTLEAFGARLRDEVDLGTLTVELRAVVADTMQPAHMSLWTRKVSP